MLNTAAKHLSRALTSRLVHRTAKLGLGPTYLRPSILERSPPSRFLHDGISGSTGNHVSVSLQMINYAFSHARSHKSDDSYGESMLVLEQCLGQAHDNDDSKALVFMAMSTLLSERGNYDDAIEKLKGVQDLSLSSIGVRVAAMEALVGLHLELGQDDSSKVLADKCLEILGQNELESSGEGGEIIRARAKAVKGLVELVHGNIQSAESFFIVPGDNKGLTGSATLSYGEFLHSTHNFSLAKELYQNVVQQLSEKKDFSNPDSLAACNMSQEEVLLAATCALGQLEAQLGNFGDAEDILTRALTKAEEDFGSYHPKVGVVLTSIALMFRRKATQERSSSLLIQEAVASIAL
ncbi:uncharacterized protein LOC21392795 isoform X2 [Morus notabilis]|uniref:uncharacterized protein LOC21392795 isoform X2 n=1 Tax=Morus notabilis TaxID=981085 RepID=UPI000CED7F59|nr:uncharacterized protein LOC21392795 isoform X2 [Morus notabilis]